MKKEIDEAAVWKRVTAAGGREPWESRDAADSGLRLALQEGAALYGGLMKLYGRTGNARFSRLAGQQHQENQKIKSLAFLLTGEKIVPPSTAAGERSLKELLEQQQRHLNTLRSLQSTGDGAMARIIQGAEERFDTLLELLGQRL